MEKFVIEGRVPLSGTIAASGSKNAALPLVSACLLTDEPLILHNVPAIADVRVQGQLLRETGVTIDELDAHTWRLQARDVSRPELDPALCRQVRTSILLAGPMLGRLGQVELPPPGGDVIGRRRLDTHILALEGLGAQISFDGVFRMRAPALRGADILFDEASVTATENAVMAAVRARGTSVLRNVASEPHVQDLCRCLVQMGARIEGIGSNTLTIEGVERLHGTEYTIGADYIEVGSYIALAAVTGGALTIERASPEHQRMTHLMFGRLGIHFEDRGDTIVVPPDQELQMQTDLGGKITKVEDAPWPGFPADLMSIAIVAATQARGTVLFHEKLFEARLFFVDRLVGMGAQIVLCDPHRCVVIGPNRLQGETAGIPSPDIRAGMALLIAALCAEGTTVIRNIGQIDRGYERIEDKLRALGARIERVAD
jgi:UDP-N-acetylglucosamine 1-carboxyvinyltransferase